ncbi:MAG: RepB family protein [Sarcina sp.]
MKNVWIEEELYGRLKEHCKREGFTIKGLIEKLVREYLSKI